MHSNMMFLFFSMLGAAFCLPQGLNASPKAEKTENVTLSNGGNVEFPGGKMSMLLWNSAWSRHGENAPRQPGPDGQTPSDDSAPYAVSGESLGFKGAAIEGSVSVSDDGGGTVGIRNSWRAVRDFEGHLWVSLALDAATAGRLWTFDGAEVAVCESSKGKAPFSGLAQTVGFSAGGRTYRLQFEEPVKMALNGGKKAELRILPYNACKSGERGGFSATLSADVPLKAVRARPFIVREGADWLPIDHRKDIVAGSALDFSKITESSRQAGRLGWLKVVGDHFEYEGAPGRKVRFAGVNVVGELCFPADDAEADRLLDRVTRYGYNAVRPHHFDNAKGLLAGSPDGFTIAPDRFERFDRFVAKCIERGVFISTDLYTSRETGISGYKGRIFFDTEAQEDWRRWAKQFLCHVNKFTGRAYKDEPAIGILSLINEGMFNGGRREVDNCPAGRAHFAKWAESRGIAKPNSGNDDQFAQYVAFCEMETFAWQRTFLRELGVKALLTDAHGGPFDSCAPVLKASRDAYDFIDQHAYHDHPSWLGKRFRPPWRLLDGGVPPLSRPSQSPIGVRAFHRAHGKPYTVSEWNVCGPGRFRGQAGLFVGALAAMQDWSGVWRFALSHGKYNYEDNAGAPNQFDVLSDPLAIATDRAVCSLYLRGDAAPLDKEYVNVVPESFLSQKKSICPSNSLDIILRARVSSVNEGTPEAKGFAIRGDMPPAADDAPLAANRENGAFTVATARTAGGFGFEGERFDAGAVRAVLSRGFASVFAISLDGAPLGESRRILACHSPDVQGEGFEWEGERGDVFVSKPDGPGALHPLVFAARAKIAIAVQGGAAGEFRVFALGTDGARRFEVPCVFRNGRIGFEMNARGADGKAVILYEIERRNQLLSEIER